MDQLLPTMFLQTLPTFESVPSPLIDHDVHKTGCTEESDPVEIEATLARLPVRPEERL